MNQTRFSMKKQLFLIFGIISCLLVLVSGMSIYSYETNVNDTRALLDHTATRTVLVRDAQNGYISAMLGMRAFLMYTEPHYESEFWQHFKKSRELMQNYENQSTKADSRELSKKLNDNLAIYDQIAQRAFAAKKGNSPELPAILKEGKAKVTEIEQGFAALRDLQDQYMKSNMNQLEAKNQRGIYWTLIIACSGLVLVVVLSYWYSRFISNRLLTCYKKIDQVVRLDLTGEDVKSTVNDELGDIGRLLNQLKHTLRNLVQKLQLQSEQLASAGEELSATVAQELSSSEVVTKNVQNIAQGMNHTSQHITTMSATLEEVSAGSQELSAGSSEVNERTQQAVLTAEDGMNKLEQVVSQNEKIVVSMQEMNTSITELAQNSKQIQGIVDLITSIAEQTNLLALNAAIEAARAGEAGKGFAVVAEEVRKLAEQSATATKQIESIILGMDGKMTTTVHIMGKASQEVAEGKVVTESTQQEFKAIVEQLTRVRENIQQMTQAILESSQGNQALVGSVNELSSKAQENSNHAAEVAQIISDQTSSFKELNQNAASLSNMADELTALIHQFKI